MALFGKSRSDEARNRLKQLEKKLDLDMELPKQYRDRSFLRQEEEKSSSAGFLGGLAAGVILGVVLAILFGRKSNGEVMDQFAQRAETLKGSATERYQQVRGDTGSQGGSVSDQFGGGAAIEREVHAGDESGLGTAEETIDSASEDVRDSMEEVSDATEDTTDASQRTWNQT